MNTLKIIPLRAFKDNYIWLGLCSDSKKAFVIDPGDGPIVYNYLQEMDLDLLAILITHKHYDHTGGISFLLEKYPSASIYANPIEEIASITHPAFDNDIIYINELSIQFKVIATPGHTLGHVCYYTNNMLFCGDTLFGAGCGRVFEGTYDQMHDSLNRLLALPDNTLIYCAHEYTLNNLKFALYLEPDNSLIKKRIAETSLLISQNKPTIPSLLRLEKETNPFLRSTSPPIKAAAERFTSNKLNTSSEVFSEIRKLKNNF